MCHSNFFNARSRLYIRSPCIVNITWTGELQTQVLRSTSVQEGPEKAIFHVMLRAERGSLTTLVLSSISLVNLIVKPHVGNCHAVLCQSACFVRTDGGCGTQGLHSLEVLHQAVLTSHTLGC